MQKLNDDTVTRNAEPIFLARQQNYIPLGQGFWGVSVLNVFPYISLCQMKRP